MTRDTSSIFRRFILLLTACLTLGGLCAAPSLAATFTVNSTADVPAADPATGCSTEPGGSVCTLRSAIQAADSAPGASTISLPAGTYQLQAGAGEGEIPVTGADITLAGAGAASTKIQGDSLSPTAVGADRIFEVMPDAGLTVSGVTLTGGNTLGIDPGTGAPAAGCSTNPQTNAGPGGAILDDGTLTLDSDVLESNLAAGTGGAVADQSSTGDLHITATTFQSDSACTTNSEVAGASYPSYVGFGGAISNLENSKVTIANSTLNDNYADNGGGAFAEWGSGSDAISSSTLDDNTAGASGGAVSADASETTPESQASVTFDADTMSGNRTSPGDSGPIEDPGGGAVYVYGDATSFENSTITGNTSESSPGGGIGVEYQTGFETRTPYAGSAVISFSTITDNTADGSAAPDGNAGANLAVDVQGGLLEAAIPFSGPLAARAVRPDADIAPNPDSAGITVDDSIVTGGHDAATGGTSNCEQDENDVTTSGLVTSDGFNVYDDTSCPQTSGDQALAAGTKVVSALADNGGPTQTESLFPGSAALDRANSDQCRAETGTPAVDQRGVSRPQGPACDVGAFELQLPDLTLSASPNPATVPVGGSSVVTDTIANVGAGTATDVVFSDPSSGPYRITGASSPHGTCTTTASTVSCSLGSLAPAASTTVSINVVGTAVGTITLDSAVSEDQTDPTPADNLSAVTIKVITAPGSTPQPPTTTTTTTTTTPTPTPVPAQADLGITKTASATQVRTGTQVLYTLEVTDHGPDTGTGVLVGDQLPAGEKLVGASIKGARCAVADTTLRCVIGTLRYRHHVTVTYAVRVTGTGTLVNHTRVSSTSHDPNPSNNTAQATVRVLAAPPVMCMAREEFRDLYNPAGRVTVVQIWRDGRLLKSLSGANLRRVSVTPPRHTRSFTLRVRFYESNQATTTETRSYRDCRPGATHIVTRPPVPPAQQS